MEQFFQFNFNTQNLNDKYACNPGQAVNGGNFAVQNTAKSTVYKNNNEQDSFQNSKNKKYMIFGSIAAGALILGVLAKTGKLKKLFSKITAGQSVKTQASQGIVQKNSAKVPTTEEITLKTQSENSITETKPVAKNDSTPAITAQKPRISFIIRNKKKFKIINRSKTPSKEGNKGNAPKIKYIRKPEKRIPILANKAISGILDKEKLTAEDLRRIEEIFKGNTRINLYCPERYNIDDFRPFFDLIFDGKFNKRLDSKIKHIIIGHGIGSAKNGNWRFIHTKENVFDFIEKNIPKGDMVLVMTCEETANRIKPGLGTPVNITLQQADKPGKIVKSGERRIIGIINQNNPKIQYF